MWSEKRQLTSGFWVGADGRNMTQYLIYPNKLCILFYRKNNFRLQSARFLFQKQANTGDDSGYWICFTATKEQSQLKIPKEKMNSIWMKASAVTLIFLWGKRILNSFDSNYRFCRGRYEAKYFKIFNSWGGAPPFFTTKIQFNGMDFRFLT